MPDYKIISGDSHIVEPPDLWTKGIEARFRARAPRIERKVGGYRGVESDWWVADGADIQAYGDIAQAGVRYDQPEEITRSGKWEDVPESAYNPDKMVAALEIDDVWGAIIQPAQGLFWYRLPDSDLLSAVCRAWNNYVADFCQHYPKRLRGIAMINLDDVEEGCRELERCASIGVGGAFIPVYPLPDRPYNHPIYDRFWWTAQDLGLPLLLHIATTRPGVPGCEFTANREDLTGAGFSTASHWVQYSLAAMVFAGVFDRYPGLKVGSVEFETSWVPHLLRRMDFTYAERLELTHGYRSKRGLCPSEQWHENMFIEFMEDDEGIQMRHMIGVDNMVWGNDFPHSESTWPRSMDFLDRVFQGSPEEE